MSFRAIRPDIMLRGITLAIVEHLFPDRVPSLTDYSRESEVAPSTFRRGAQWLLSLLPRILETRRPGPPSEDPAVDSSRLEALRKLEDLWAWLQKNRSQTKKNNCYTPEAKQRIASLSEEILTEGTLSLAEIAAALDINERQLRRICDQVREAGGEPPVAKSRRPRNTRDLAGEIQKLIVEIEESASSRSPYTGADIRRILETNYKEELKRHHGSETICEDTVRKYMKNLDRAERDGETQEQEHPRGNYHYPEPFQQVAIDTSHFKLFGWTFYFITVFEFAGRLNLVTRVFLRENTKAVVSVVEEYLGKFPSVEVTVIDRGTPYLNEEVKAILQEYGKLRVVCRPEAPTEKAAIERHFRTLKEAIRPAVSKVFPEDPHWPRKQLANLLEVGVAVFQELYHQIPQEGIDGKSPAERIQSFDPVRASAAMVELFRRAQDSEPAKEYAAEIHRRFQLPGREEDTAKKLRQFPTRALRAAVEEIGGQLGPPRESYIYDPVGYIAAKAHEISRRDREEYYEERYRRESSLRLLEGTEETKTALEKEARECRERPERYIDQVLKRTVFLIEKGFQSALRPTARRLGELLEALSRNLGRAFSAEVRRLKERVGAFSKDVKALEAARRLLEDLTSGLEGRESAPGGATR